jgi:hypothetical protein
MAMGCAHGPGDLSLHICVPIEEEPPRLEGSTRSYYPESESDVENKSIDHLVNIESFYL